MMNVDELNAAFVTIVEKKEQLHKLNPNEGKYGEIKSEVDSLESNFLSQYGSYLEDAIFNIHDEFCPDNETSFPLSYIASKYEKTMNGKVMYDVKSCEGVSVEPDDFPGIKSRLVLIPNPTRLVLHGEQHEFKETVWVAH